VTTSCGIRRRGRREERTELLLAGQTVLVIGGSSGIGLETARRAHAEGAQVIITARDPERVQRAGLELGARIAAFDATDFDRLANFFVELREPLDHVLVAGPGPHDVPSIEFDIEEARHDVEAHLLLPLQVAREGAARVRPNGSLLFTGCSDGRQSSVGPGFVSAITDALSAMTKRLAMELAPLRVNVIVAGFIATPSSEAMLGDRFDARREQLRESLPVRRVVSAADVAALAVHLMVNTAISGVTFPIDGGQRLIEG